MNDREFSRAVNAVLWKLAFHCGRVVFLPTIKGSKRFMVCGAIDENGRPNLDDYTYSLAPMEDWPTDQRRILLGDLIARGLREEGSAKRTLDALIERCKDSVNAVVGTYDPEIAQRTEPDTAPVNFNDDEVPF